SLIEDVCNAAIKYKIGAVLTLPSTGLAVSEKLKNTGVKAVCTIELISGVACTSESRRVSINLLMDAGIKDFDITTNWAKYAEKDYDAVRTELAEFATLVHSRGGIFGVPIEVGTLSESDQLIVSKLAIEAGADYVKTASGTQSVSGIDTGRANFHNICLLKENFGDKIKIKAGGGTDFAYLEDVWEYLQTGAERVDIGKQVLEQLERISYKA
ncbi:MAG: hypothetical protein ACYDG2_16265, partial [Ruminiclostridium sp.]